MKIILKIVLIVSSFWHAGCASLPPDTTSGNPEIILTQVRFDCVRTVFMESFMNQGYTIRNASDTQIVAGRKATHSPILYHTFYGGTPEERITITFFPTDIPDALRVVSTAAYVENPATANEVSHPVAGTLEDQDFLQSMQTTIENRCRK